MAKWAGFTDEQSRQLDALRAHFDTELAKHRAPDRVVDRRGASAANRPRPGDVVRADAGDVVVLPHPRSAKGRAPVVVLVEGQPVTVLADSGTVNDQEEVVVTALGAMEWWSTGTEWWGTAVGGAAGGGGGGGVDPATCNEDGFLSRRVYVNAASARLGTTFAGVTTIAAANLTTAADLPDGNWFIVEVAAGGGGTAGGSCGLTGRGGSPGAGGGARHRVVFSRQELLALLPITISVGLGGVGGVGEIRNAAGGVVRAATAGTAGGTSRFGDVYAYGGGASHVAAAVNNIGATGGGHLGAGITTTNTNAAQRGGFPAVTAGNWGIYGDGGGTAANAGTAGAANSISNAATYGGAAGGGTHTPTASNQAAYSGGVSVFGGGGGGAGGCEAFDQDGGEGGGHSGGLRFGGGGAGGAGLAGNGGGTAGSGTAGADGNATQNGAGGGGGGVASLNNFAVAGNAVGGSGGDGGFPGGGAGGAGGTRNQTGSGTSTNTAGDGADGGDGAVIITAFL